MRSNNMTKFPPFIILFAVVLLRVPHVTAWAAPSPGPFADKALCQPQLADANNNTFLFDWSAAAWHADLTFTDSSNRTFFIAPCGTTRTLCSPPWYNTSFGAVPQGPAVVMWGEPPACERACMASDGSFICCSAACEVIGAGPPMWALADPSNAVNGGLIATYWMWFTPWVGADPFPCPGANPISSPPLGRNLTIVAICNESMTQSDVVLVSVSSVGCGYTAVLAAKAACGRQIQLPTSPLPLPASAPIFPPTPGPFMPYLCTPSLVDAFGALWSFNLTSLPLEYKYTSNYYISICGTNSRRNAVSDKFAYTYGSIVQYWSGINELLAIGPPLWTLLNAGNGATGGLRATWAQVPRLPSDPLSQCPQRAGGYRLWNTITLEMTCDATTLFTPTNVADNGDCTFVLQARSRGACGAWVPATSTATPSATLTSSSSTSPSATHSAFPTVSAMATQSSSQSASASCSVSHSTTSTMTPTASLTPSPSPPADLNRLLGPVVGATVGSAVAVGATIAFVLRWQSLRAKAKRLRRRAVVAELARKGPAAYGVPEAPGDSLGNAKAGNDLPIYQINLVASGPIGRGIARNSPPAAREGK